MKKPPSYCLTVFNNKGDRWDLAYRRKPKRLQEWEGHRQSTFRIRFENIETGEVIADSLRLDESAFVASHPEVFTGARELEKSWAEYREQEQQPPKPRDYNSELKELRAMEKNWTRKKALAETKLKKYRYRISRLETAKKKAGQ